MTLERVKEKKETSIRGKCPYLRILGKRKACFKPGETDGGQAVSDCSKEKTNHLGTRKTVASSAGDKCLGTENRKRTGSDGKGGERVTNS